MLEASEYLHLAIRASNEDNHHAALEYLHKALEREPQNARARYFLAAEHAELGLIERACSGMLEALEIEPTLEIARFQLGLLYLQLSKPPQARSEFETLSRQGNDKSLMTFAGAYIDLLDEKPEEAKSKLAEGLKTSTNPALNSDMARVLSSLTSTDSELSLPHKQTEATPIFLGAYRDNIETESER